MADPKLNKPTPEELKAKEDEAIKAAKELEGRQQIPPDDPEEPENPAPVVDPDDEPDTDPDAEPEVEEPQADPSKELFKKKASASARENQKIYAKNRVINKALANASGVTEPTEEELQAEFKDWDVMSDIEKGLAKETVMSRNSRKIIADAIDQGSKIEKWNESVDEFVDDPNTLLDHPELEGKTDAFREFALTEANNSVPFNLLVSAFLHESAKNKPVNKGRMFERGSGGPNEKPQLKGDFLTLEEGRKLRETNYPLWKEKLAAGKIQTNL